MAGSIAKNTLYLTLASVGQKAIAFVYFLFLARIMGPEQTGRYFLALSIMLVFAVIADFGITPVVIREVAKVPERAKQIVREAIGLKLPFMVLSVIASISATLVLGYDPEVLTLVLFAQVILIADTLSLLFYGTLRGLQDLRFESLGVFIGQCLTGILGGLVLVFSPSLVLLVCALSVGSLFNAVFSCSQVVKRLGKQVIAPVFDRRRAKKFLLIALPFALAAIFVKVYSYVDTLLLAKFLDEVSVGIYAIAYKFTYAFQFLPLAFVAALYPGLSHMLAHEKEELPRAFNSAMRYMILIGAPIVFGLWAIAPEVVSLAGEGFDESATVLRWLVFVLIPIFLDFPIGSLLNAADRQVTKTTIMGATMVLNVVLNVWLIPIYGVLGAAYAALVSFTFLFLAGLWFVPQIIPQYRFGSLFKVVAPVLISAALMGGVALALSSIGGLFLAIPGAAIVYLGLLLLTRAVTMEELNCVRSRLWNQSS